MKKAILVHETMIVEYIQNGEKIAPTKEQKLLWDIFGMPEDIIKNTVFEKTVIDTFYGKTKKSIYSQYDQKMNAGDYLSLQGFMVLCF